MWSPTKPLALMWTHWVSTVPMRQANGLAKMGKNGELFRLSPGDFDGTVSLKDMKKKGVNDEQMYAYLQARCMYLEEALKYEQEKRKISTGKNFVSKNHGKKG